MSIVLHYADCFDVFPSIKDESIDLILTDPPYGTTACKWDSILDLDEMWKHLLRIAKPDTAIVIFGNEPFSSYLRLSNIKYYKYDWIWNKVNKFTGALNANKMPMLDHELLSVFYRKQPIYNKQLREGGYTTRHGGNRNTESTRYVKPLKDIGREVKGLNPKRILDFPSHRTNKLFHPTEKPVSILEYIIKTYSLEGQTVLDFTMGSGSTGVACKNTNRNFIGIEKEIEYYNIAKQRVLTESNNQVEIDPIENMFGDN